MTAEAKPDEQAITHRRPPRIVNALISLVLRTPLHGAMSAFVLLLTFKGRKSGKRYTIPLGYHQEDKLVTVFTEYGWWKNLQANPEVTLYLKGQKAQGRAEIIRDSQVVADELTTFFRRVPKVARSLRDSTGEPIPAAVQKAAQTSTCIKIHLS